VITVLPGRELSRHLADRWRRIQASNATLASPYFSPEFTAAVAAARDDVHVAVIEREGRITAFFPHHKLRRTGLPVGGAISDFHGLVCGPDFIPDVVSLMRGCRLDAFDFDHLLTSQLGFAAYTQYCESSPRIDLSAGYAAYVEERRHAGSEQIKKCGNLLRRLEREVGPVSFIAHSDDLGMLAQVLAWKSEQYCRTGCRDLFSRAWVRRVIEVIHATQGPGFAGRLSLLYAGDTLIAGHFGMKTAEIWHYWFPSFDKRFSKYSPGLLLLLKLAEHAAAEGVSYIDLGKGMTLYKERLMNARVLLGAGCIELPSVLRVRRAVGRSLRSLARQAIFGSPLEAPARRLVHALRPR
jgi:CelD/BcsL family acetyltransferase involved in cellulose biosynthesis